MLAIIQAAGWPIWPLLIASVITVALIIERSLGLRAAKIAPDNLTQEVLTLYKQRQISADVLTRLEKNSPLGKVLAAGLRQDPQGRDAVRTALEDAGRAAAHDLSKFLNALATISTVAPLLGLLGTVIGMIEIFGATQQVGANPQQLAHGISVALYNTAFGLIVAIPALIAFRFFRAKVDDILAAMEKSAAQLAAIAGQGR